MLEDKGDKDAFSAEDEKKFVSVAGCGEKLFNSFTTSSRGKEKLTFFGHLKNVQESVNKELRAPSFLQCFLLLEEKGEKLAIFA
ncbi:MAG: hypothetical protein COX62_08410 [Deltaproteobacteria bacterium CG_4_10_14_0_2_um_filter_43_8]|nr:MAG: hypothetical protein COV43_02135 [Deltaproteobacteria bacterium CG11_big_fil_rev_8_21_14_0_20_42_23]PJA18707.1 MAG: hypothetical protein COX62_08410 [Deltaproteobacteria bacterium CG_4_10_14_0_2_um_filter_43_8]PJC64729.1 MAG: hypothetical protein CO021_02670 [Deltaproteobacteria bacterium CG_4_9_14_0_2_um_filter_42_21]